MTCDPTTLSKLSSCLRCLTDAQLMQIKTYLFCQWFSKVASLAPTNADITPDSGTPNITVTWTNPTRSGATNEVWRSTDGGVTYSLFTTVAGSVSQIVDHSVQPANSIWYYKVRTCSGGSCSAFTDPAGISQSFTSANVASISLPFLVQSSGNFTASGLAALTSVSLPKLHSSLGIINISANPNLTTISLPAIKTVGLGFLLGANNITGALSFPALISTGADFQAQSNTLMTSISAPLLTSVAGNFQISGCSGLTSINFNSLQTVGAQFIMGQETSLVSFSFPALTSVSNDASFTGCTALTSASFPALTTLNPQNVFSMNGSGCTVLATLSIPVLATIADGFTFDISACALNAASVNLVLARGVVSGVTTTTFNLNGGTNAAPSGQGVNDKATLIARGNTVNTN